MRSQKWWHPKPARSRPQLQDYFDEFISEIHFFQLDDMTCYLGLPDERTFNFKPQMQMQYEYFDWGTHFINS